MRFIFEFTWVKAKNDNGRCPQDQKSKLGISSPHQTSHFSLKVNYKPSFMETPYEHKKMK